MSLESIRSESFIYRAKVDVFYLLSLQRRPISTSMSSPIHLCSSLRFLYNRLRSCILSIAPQFALTVVSENGAG